MNSVEKTVEAIKLLIAGGDLSDSLHLRQLHKEITGVYRELNDNLEKCRKLVENGSIQAARELNGSFDPSLVQVADCLEYFKTSDFFAVCQDYGLDMPQSPDEKLLQLLNTPVSSGEKRLHALFQDYRHIARTGTMLQRISLLRQIVRKLPKSARWRNDLIAAERSRCLEIERELGRLNGGEEDCQTLESLYREVLDPEWGMPPKPELVAAIQKKLQPQQRAKMNKEVDARLQKLQDCWMERDIDRLEKEFEEWKAFCCNPLISLTADQRQAERDVETFLKNSAEEKKQEMLFQELIRKIERKLGDDLPFSEVAGDYNQLKLMDRQIPIALEERLQALEEEKKRYEHMRNVRRCIFGICGAVLLIVVIVFSVRYSQHFLAVQRNCANMQALLEEKRYDEVDKIFQELSEASPEVAAEPRIILLHTTANTEREKAAAELKMAEEKFARIIRQIEQLARMDVLDNAAVLDKAIASGRDVRQKFPISGPLLDKFGNLETRVTQKRTDLKKQWEQDFLQFCSRSLKAFDDLLRQIPQARPEEQAVAVKLLKQRFQEKMNNSPYVPEHLKKQQIEKFQGAETRYSEAWTKEKAFREVYLPENFYSYLSGLDRIRYDYPDLAQRYSTALRSIKMWQQEHQNYSGSLPRRMDDVHNIKTYGNGLFRQDLERIIPKQIRSAGFSKFFSDIRKQKDLKELVLTDPNGKEYFFYVSGPIRIERLRNPVRTNITFTANAVGQEKNRRFVFSYSAKNKAAPFVLKSTHGDLPYKLPAAFALMGGESGLPKSLDTCWPGHALTEKFSALNSDGPGLFTNLQEALKFICEDGNVKNIYLKEMLFNAFVQELYGVAPNLCPEVGEVLPKLQETQMARAFNWRAPQANPKYAEDKAALDAVWSRLDLPRLLEAGKVRGDFVCSAHARRLIPVGVVQGVVQDKVRTHFFTGRKRPAEGVVIDNGAVWAIPDGVWQGEVPRDPKWRRRLFCGQVIWAYGDQKSTREFLREWQQKARHLNVKLSLTPSVFPAGQDL